MPTDWVLPTEWQTWAEQERQDLDISKIAASFKDYWIAKPGSGGLKLNWEATWRNWVRSQKQSFGVAKDVVRQTTPTPPNAFDALQKIRESDKMAVKPPAEILEKMALLRKGVA